MKTYYVWYDNLLEELFSLEKNELDNTFNKLKTQLDTEKVVFTVVEAENQNHAYEMYRATLPKIDMDNEKDDISDFIPSLPTSKKHLH